MTDPQLWAAKAWPTNAEMIDQVVALGYIRPDDHLVDLTYGDGVWWNNYAHPGPMTVLTRGAEPPPRDGLTVARGYDFRDLPATPGWHSSSANVVAFDPPYVAKGGRETSTIDDMDAAYGLRDAPATPRLLQQHNEEGAAAAAWLLAPGGYLLWKCMDYVSSGSLQPATLWTYRFAVDELGLKLCEHWSHVGKPGPQPKKNPDGSDRAQKHARYNFSVLYIFRKPGRRPRAKKVRS